MPSPKRNPEEATELTRRQDKKNPVCLAAQVHHSQGSLNLHFKSAEIRCISENH